MAIDRRGMLMATGAAAALGTAPLARAAQGQAQQSEGAIAVRLLERYHPGLLRYQSVRDWQQRASGFAASFDRETRPAARFVKLARLLGAIRCSHTHINPFNQSDEMVARHYATGSRLLPFDFEWRGGRMFVTGDPHGVGLEGGREVSTVDGGGVLAIQAAMLPMTRADGGLDNKRRALLSVGKARRFETFDWLAAPLMNVRETVVLGLGRRGQRQELRRVPTITLAGRRAVAPPPLPRDADMPWWTMETRGDIAVLTMPSWAVFNTRWDWKGWLDTAMDGIARDGTRALVIDLRGNEGGYFDCGRALLERLAAAPVPLPAEQRLSRLGTVAEEDRPYLTTWDDSLYTIGAAFRAAGNGFREVPREGDRTIRPRGQRFAGPVAVLVGADNSSATGIFAEIVKAHRLGLLVGQETGRNRRGGNGDAFFFARLPRADLGFDIPLVASHRRGFHADRGTLPDVPVPLAATLRTDGVDVTLEAALRSLGARG